MCNFYHSTHRSVLVPSICKFLATVKGKEETKTVKAAGIAVESFQESAFRMRGSYNVTVVQSIFPTSLPFWRTTKYNFWLLLKVSCLLIYLLPYFSHWIEAFKGKTSDVVIFEQITDPLRQFSLFFFCLLSRLLFLSLIMKITHARKWNVHEYNGSVFTYR